MADELAWKDVVRDAIIELGGSAHLRQINEKIAGHPRTKTNPTWKDTIRRVVRQYSIFEPVPPHRSGIYRYVAPPPIPEPLPEPKPVEAADPHGEIQGMMLRLGHLYGYEVFAPSNDRTTRQFQGVPLSSLTTVSADLREVSTKNHREIARIDVVWFGEDDDGIFPCYAYEVEHTTKVRDSLSRLLKIPARYPCRRYVLSGGDEQHRLFEQLIVREPFRPHGTRFAFRAFEQVRQFYNAAICHEDARVEFGVEYSPRRR